MKYIILLAFVALAAAAPKLSDEAKAHLRQYSQECEPESHVDKEILKKLKEGVIPDNANLKKHLFCVNKKSGIQKANGEIDVDVFRTKIGQQAGADKIEELVTKCAVNKGNGEETAWEAAKCIKEHHHD